MECSTALNKNIELDKSICNWKVSKDPSETQETHRKYLKDFNSSGSQLLDMSQPGWMTKGPHLMVQTKIVCVGMPSITGF